MAVLLYGTSFFIERFSLSEGIASFVILGAALFYTLGSVVAGSMVNRYGRKFSTVSTALLAGLFTISYAFVPSLFPSLALNFTAAWFMGMMASAASSLTLEQVPRFRGSMMSISSAATSLGGGGRRCSWGNGAYLVRLRRFGGHSWGNGHNCRNSLLSRDERSDS